MSFSIDSQYCSVLKGVQPLVKAQNTSISASQKNQTVSLNKIQFVLYSCYKGA